MKPIGRNTPRAPLREMRGVKDKASETPSTPAVAISNPYTALSSFFTTAVANFSEWISNVQPAFGHPAQDAREIEILRTSYDEGNLWIEATPPAGIESSNKYDRLQLGTPDRALTAYVLKEDRNRVFVREGSLWGRDSWKQMVQT